MDLTDAVVLITGAGSGIGAAGARLFAEHGSRVCLVDLAGDELQQQVAEIESDGGVAMAREADLRSEADVSAAVAATVEKWGRLDVVWANAGIGGIQAPVDRIGADEWDEVLDINLRGAFLTVKHAVPHMRERGGSIIITSSTSGNRTFTDMGSTAYSVSKAALTCLAKMLSVELGPDNIRVNALCPGATDTKLSDTDYTRDMEELKRPIAHPDGDMLLEEDNTLDPRDVAQVALLLAQTEIVTGTEVYADGGQSLIT